VLNRVEDTGGNVVLRNVRVLDVRNGELGEPSSVAVSHGVIKNINAGSEFSDYDVIDGNGHTLGPGLINCHAHILSPFLSEQKGFLGAWAFRQMQKNLEATLAAGVVCVRDMLSPIKVMNSVRRKVASGRYIGPDIVASGAVLSCNGGYPEFIHPLYFPLSALIGQPKLNLQTPRKADAMVRYLVRCGAEVAKVGYTSFTREFDNQQRMPTVTPDVLAAICKAAHEEGVRVSVHHNWSEDLPKILDADIDTLEHLVYDRVLTDEEVQLVKDRGVTIVPTLTVSDSMARFEEKKKFLEGDRAKEMFEEQARQHLLYIADTWLDFKGESYHKSFGFWRANRKNFAGVQQNARKIIAAGIPICAGTDLGAVVAFPGEMADELKRLNYAGMAPPEALRAATIDAARLVGREKELGTVEPGKRADVVLFDGNPLEDLDALRRVRLVGRSGSWYRPKHPEVPDFWPGHETIYRTFEDTDLADE